MTSYATLAQSPEDEDIPILRELLSYDMLCPASCQFSRGTQQELMFTRIPSPLHWSRQMEWPWALRNSSLDKSHTCLDIGGGWSVLKYAIAKRCWQLISLEPNQHFIDVAERSIRTLGANNITQVLGGCEAIPFPNNHFDRVFCVSVLEHIRVDHIKCIREAIRVCKPGGTIIFTMDVRVRGTMADDFFVDEPLASQFLMELGLNSVSKQTAAGATLGGVCDIIVMMVRYVKGMI